MHTFIFDFDGTLADTLEHAITIGNALAEEFDFKRVERHQIETFRNKTIRQSIWELDVPIFKIPRILLRGKKEQHDRIEEVQLIEGISDVLLQLQKQNVKLGLVSTNSTENIQAVLKNHNIENVFDFICVGPGLFGKHRTLKKAIQKYQLNTDQTIYIGDEVRDIEAARKAGIAIISVTWGYNSSALLRANEPDYLIHHPGECLRLLQSKEQIRRIFP